jgi:hypothetical protein
MGLLLAAQLALQEWPLKVAALTFVYFYYIMKNPVWGDATGEIKKEPGCLISPVIHEGNVSLPRP